MEKLIKMLLELEEECCLTAEEELIIALAIKNTLDISLDIINVASSKL